MSSPVQTNFQLAERTDRLLVRATLLRKMYRVLLNAGRTYAAFTDKERPIWGDMGYRGQRLKEWIEQELEWKMEIVKRPSKWGRFTVDVEPEPMPSLTVLRRRWVVERSFAWVGRYRRMSKDYEYLPQSSEAMIHLVMSRLMLRRLALKAPYGVPSRRRLGLKR